MRRPDCSGSRRVFRESRSRDNGIGSGNGRALRAGVRRLRSEVVGFADGWRFGPRLFKLPRGIVSDARFARIRMTREVAALLRKTRSGDPSPPIESSSPSIGGDARSILASRSHRSRRSASLA